MTRWLFILLTAVTAMAQTVIVDPYRFGSPPGNNLLTDLEAGWRFEETSGHPQDSSGNARHLTEFGTLETATGIVGNSRTHDTAENDDYFSVASDTWNTFGTNDFTVAYWFKPSDAAGTVDDQVHVAKGDLAGETSWIIEIDSGFAYSFGHAMIFYASTDGVIPGQPLLTVEFDEVIAGSDIWYCVVVKRTGDDFMLYLGRHNEGAFMGSDTETQAGELWDNSSIPLSVGNIYAGYPTPSTTHDTQGEIDELYIWSRALSECEIFKFFNAGVGRVFTTFDANPCE